MYRSLAIIPDINEYRLIVRQDTIYAKRIFRVLVNPENGSSGRLIIKANDRVLHDDMCLGNEKKKDVDFVGYEQEVGNIKLEVFYQYKAPIVLTGRKALSITLAYE